MPVHEVKSDAIVGAHSDSSLALPFPFNMMQLKLGPVRISDVFLGIETVENHINPIGTAP